MLRLNLTKDVLAFLSSLERKHAGQLALKIMTLLDNPHAQDVKPLKGALRAYLRADSGEYRIIFFIEGDELRVVLIGQRNDGDVYKALSRKR